MTLATGLAISLVASHHGTAVAWRVAHQPAGPNPGWLVELFRVVAVGIPTGFWTGLAEKAMGEAVPVPNEFGHLLVKVGRPVVMVLGPALIQLHIALDGSWFRHGPPLDRPALVQEAVRIACTFTLAGPFWLLVGFFAAMLIVYTVMFASYIVTLPVRSLWRSVTRSPRR